MIETFKSIMGKLKRTGFVYVFGSSSVNKFISFISGIVLVRIVSKEEYGVYSYAYNIISFFLIAASCGVYSGYLQIGSETKEIEKRKHIYSYSASISFFSNIALAIVVLLVSWIVPLPLKGANFYLGLMAFFPLIQYLYEMQFVFLRVELRNKEFSISNTVSTVLVFLLSCCFSYFFSVNGLIVGRYLAYFLTFVFIALRFRVSHPISIHSSIDSKIKKLLWQVSVISMLNNGLSRLMYLLDIFVLGVVIPSETVIASYKVATTIPTALAFIPGAVLTYVYPYFAKNKDNKKWVLKKYGILTASIGLGCGFLALIMCIFAEPIISIAFGTEYLDAVACFRILCISFAFSATFRTLAGTILVTQRRLYFNLIIAMFSGVLNTVLNYYLITQFQSIGASYATLITVIVTGILNVIYLLLILCKKKGSSNEFNKTN